MLSLKPGVRLFGLRPETLLALVVAYSVYQDEGLDCIVTSGVDGTHKSGSLHYSGAAFDLRIHNVPLDKRAPLYARLKAALGEDYDVLWEAKGTPNEHLHVEYNPKKGINQ